MPKSLLDHKAVDSMKTKAVTFLLSLFIFFTKNLIAQQDSVKFFIQEHQTINKKAMLALGAWSIGNGIYSLNQLEQSSNLQAQYFHQMNLAWSGVNLIIASTFYTKNRRKLNDQDFKTAVSLLANTTKSFGTNMLLDGVYIALGISMNKVAAQNNNLQQQRLIGFGNAIAYQGAFLLAFDALLYGIHKKHGKKLHAISQHVSLYPNTIIWHL